MSHHCRKMRSIGRRENICASPSLMRMMLLILPCLLFVVPNVVCGLPWTRGSGEQNVANANLVFIENIPRGGDSSPSWSFSHHCSSMPWTPMVKTRFELMDNAHEYVFDVDDNHLVIKEVFDVDDSHLVIVGVTAPEDSDNNKDDKSNDDDDVEIVLGQKAQKLNEKHSGVLDTILKQHKKKFRAKLGSTAGGVNRVFVTQEDGTIQTMRFVVMGLGKKTDNAKTAGRKIGTAVASLLKSEKQVSTCDLVLPAWTRSSGFCSELSSSLLSDLYADQRFKSKPEETDLAGTVRLLFDKEPELPKLLTESAGEAESVIEDGNDDSEADQEVECDDIEADATDVDLTLALEAGRAMATGIYMAKDIVNSPHNTLNSNSLAETAKRIALQSRGVLKCKVLNQYECEKRGMGAYLGVARGSETSPQFIHLTYRPKRVKWRQQLRKVGIVGKGVLFDTGGYNIKTAMMELMKFDCGGAAAVLGAAMAIAALKPPGVEAHFVIAACENMINERAVVPGDILTASNGKTIEVINTDAEGRLTMADALVYADKEVGCEEIIELSTLTGACMVSLGSAMSGLWTDNEELAKNLEEASSSTGEKFWRMPLEKEYNEQLKSKIADLRNIGGKYPGAVTAALFLQNFVENKPFAHIDMAGPVWSMKTGATGYGVKLVTEWVCQQGKSD